MRVISILLLSIFVVSCNEEKKPDLPLEMSRPSLTGTWQLISSLIITKGDTVKTFPVKNQEMIKIFTENQFAFFKHDIQKGTGENAVFDAGSGTYQLKGQKYSEHLDYCSARGWEDKDFTFNLELRNDTLIQTGIEKIDSLQIDHEIVEVYTKLR